MATVPITGRKIKLRGSVIFWTAHRIPRQSIIDALEAIGVKSVPPVDNYDALVETGKKIVEVGSLKETGSPVKADSLRRSGVGCEFFKTLKGESENRRDFLFSLGVTDKDRAFPIKWDANHPAIRDFFNHPDCDTVLNAMYQENCGYMPSRDVTDALTALVFANRGIRLKESGGVYFIPDCAIDQIDSVFHDLNQAGCRCTMLVHDLAEDPDLCSQVLENTDEQLNDSLTQLQTEIRDLLDNDKKPRINGLKTKMSQLAKQADLLDYYQQMFGKNLETAQENLKLTYELLSELQLRYEGKGE